MTDPIERERLRILEERVELKRKFEEDDARLTEELTAGMSIRDRLMRRLETQTVKTALRDDLGEFEIETRLMTTGELQRAMELDRMLASGDPERYVEAMRGFSEILDEVCVTPGLTDGFWTSQDCPADPSVKVAIVLRTAMGGAEAVSNIVRRVRSFRRDT